MYVYAVLFTVANLFFLFHTFCVAAHDSCFGIPLVIFPKFPIRLILYTSIPSSYSLYICAMYVQSIKSFNVITIIISYSTCFLIFSAFQVLNLPLRLFPRSSKRFSIRSRECKRKRFSLVAYISAIALSLIMHVNLFNRPKIVYPFFCLIQRLSTKKVKQNKRVLAK